MSIGRILFLAIFLFSSAAILAGGSLAEKITYQSIPQVDLSDLETVFKQQRLKSDYQSQLLKSLDSFGGSNASYQTLEEKLLALVVPAEYRDLHFQLVAAFAELNRDQVKKPEIKERLENLSAAYGWLAAQLSVFIVNNF
ncbi:MAG: hypothetical protein A2927_00200 [Candidatus Komeilibacteria bacterium RIFCSPLOWO2_01_FULL_45_10]|uniref:Uncharacterized protein n=1 Tax=Candidatus Komeilibacteria bacterium RIFCSPLOWO2_01_FULL_45_10 TaxID=1798550 RepID=A0A1G2BNF0_9BACT|nr:MAG: hypothetical protein A2927_00200 [Candidatus Komeilibacteria bacterium RIFCSPLOWO2_01_FULL_45_10]